MGAENEPKNAPVCGGFDPNLGGFFHLFRGFFLTFRGFFLTFRGFTPYYRRFDHIFILISRKRDLSMGRKYSFPHPPSFQWHLYEIEKGYQQVQKRLSMRRLQGMFVVRAWHLEDYLSLTQMVIGPIDLTDHSATSPLKQFIVISDQHVLHGKQSFHERTFTQRHLNKGEGMKKKRDAWI
jgi:hypothetical protein